MQASLPCLLCQGLQGIMLCGWHARSAGADALLPFEFDDLVAERERRSCAVSYRSRQTGRDSFLVDAAKPDVIPFRNALRIGLLSRRVFTDPVHLTVNGQTTLWQIRWKRLRQSGSDPPD